MLNKENTKKAEQIAEQLRPLFARAYELLGFVPIVGQIEETK